MLLVHFLALIATVVDTNFNSLNVYFKYTSLNFAENRLKILMYQKQYCYTTGILLNTDL